jgi:hypothetical protein
MFRLSARGFAITTGQAPRRGWAIQVIPLKKIRMKADFARERDLGGSGDRGAAAKSGRMTPDGVQGPGTVAPQTVVPRTCERRHSPHGIGWIWIQDARTFQR